MSSLLSVDKVIKSVGRPIMKKTLNAIIIAWILTMSITATARYSNQDCQKSTHSANVKSTATKSVTPSKPLLPNPKHATNPKRAYRHHNTIKAMMCALGDR